MKTISKYMLILAAAVFTFTACEKTVEREPSPLDVPGAVLFASAGGTFELNMSKDPLETTVTLFRTSNLDKADTIQLEATAHPVFQFDPKVIFAPGDKKVDLKISFATGEADSTYTMKLAMPAEKVSPYLDGQTEFNFTVKLVMWSELRTGVWEDATIGPAFGLAVTAHYVQYQVAEQADGSQKIRILNPYRSLPTGQDDEGIYDGFAWNEDGDADFSKDYHFLLNVAADGEVRFPDIETFLGISWGSYTDMAFFDYAAYKGNPGTYGRFEKEKSKIVFDAQDNSMITELAGSLYGIQVNFQFYLSKAAYLADQTGPTPAGATVETYEGSWEVNALDGNTGEPLPARNVTIVSGVDAQGQFYTISGFTEALPEIYGYFDETTQAFMLGYNEAGQVVIDEKTYDVVLYPYTKSAWSGKAEMKFVPQADGTIALADDSEAIGVGVIYFNVDDQSDMIFGEDLYSPTFTAIDAAGAPAHKAAKAVKRQKSNVKKLHHILNMAR